MPTAQRWLARARNLARRVVPVPFRRLDPIHNRLAMIEMQQTIYHMHLDDHTEHIRNLAQRVEALSARLDAMETNLHGRLDDLAEQNETSIALGWDHVALVRRLAVLEDRLIALDATGAGLDAPRALAG